MEFKGTDEIPYLKFEEDEGLLEIRGKSICIDIIDFYKPLLEKMEEYVKEPRDIKLIIALEYFNTKSSKSLLNLFKILSTVVDNGFKFEVDWYYDENDEDILEAGEDYESILKKATFNFVEIKNENS